MQITNHPKFPGCSYKAKQGGRLKVVNILQSGEFNKLSWYLKRNDYHCTPFKNAKCPRLNLPHFDVPWNLHIILLKTQKGHSWTLYPVVMYGCESWTIKNAEWQKIDAFELWCWRRLLRVPRTVRRSNQSIQKEINPEYSLEGLMLKLKL